MMTPLEGGLEGSSSCHDLLGNASVQSGGASRLPRKSCKGSKIGCGVPALLVLRNLNIEHGLKYTLENQIEIEWRQLMH